MPLDTSVFDKIKTFQDYNQAQQDFDMRKALAAQQLQGGDTQNRLQNFQLAAGMRTTAINALSNSTDQPSYEANLSSLIPLGIDPKAFPAQFDPGQIKAQAASLLDAKEKATLALEQSKLSETTRHNQAEEYNQSGGWGAPPSAPSSGTIPNNNPGNMRPPGVTTGFQQFATPQAGMDAMVADLTAKASGRSPAMNGQRPTLRNIISTWAPAADGNDPDKYTAFVAQKTGLDPDGLVNPGDIQGKIAPAMAQFEGNKYSGQPQKDLSTLNGDEFLAELKKQNPNAPIAQIKAIANGDQPYPSPFALAKNPGMQKIVNAVYQYDPTANANRFADVNKFNVGPQGNQVRSFSVGIAHLNTLSNLADALGNGDTKAVNAIGNAVQSQMGAPAPTNFEAAKQIVADEIIKAVVGAGGGAGDREKAQAQISAASSLPQLKGVISTYKDLMKGQIGGLQQQYEVSTGRKDFMTRLTPDARAAFEAPASAAQSAPAAPPKMGEVRPGTDGNYLFNGGNPADPASWKKVK